MNVELRGTTAYAYTGGRRFDPALPAVAFVHGALHDHSVWTLLARWFAHHGHNAIAPDLPGHSRSGGPPLESIEAMADWLLALLDAAGVGDTALVGHSMGSLVALEAAARAPSRVRRLVMVGTAYPMTVSPALLDAAASPDPRPGLDSINAFSHSTIAGKPSYPGPGSWLHGANLALMQRVQAADPARNVFLDDFRACDRYAGAIAAAAKVACPVTFVVGERDQMTLPGRSTELARALEAETIVLASGHSLMMEVPDALLRAVRGAIGA